MLTDPTIPMFNLSLSMADAFAVKDALRFMAYAGDGNAEAVAGYLAGFDSIGPDPHDLDVIANRLGDIMRPVIEAEAAALRELMERHRRDILEDYPEGS